MESLKSYTRGFDSKAMPQLLAEVSNTNGNATVFSGECTISLYEVLARVHGRNIVPQIGNIMSNIMRTLSSSGGSLAVHQACSKLVPAIAHHAINALTSDEEKSRIICSLCKPLLNTLISLSESSAPLGAALCLSSLVESSNWRFASDEMINEVCSKVAGALEEKLTQSDAHIGLVMTLVKHNGLIAESHSRSFVRSGLQILAAGSVESNLQKQLMAIQMINFLMKCVDVRSISLELFRIIDAMNKCQADDKMPCVRDTAFEALQTAKALTGQKVPSHEWSPWRARNGESSDNGIASEFGSPESQTVDSSIKYDGLSDSPVSVCQPLRNFENGRRTNRKLWNYDGIGVDASLKDSFLLKACSVKNDVDPVADARVNSFLECNEVSKEYSEEFSEFILDRDSNSVVGSTTPKHLRIQPPLTTGDMKKIYTTGKLVNSLQSSSNSNDSGHMEKQDTVVPLNLPLQDTKSYPELSINTNNQSQNFICRHKGRKNLDKVDMLEKAKEDVKDAEFADRDVESVSSTYEVSDSNISMIHESAIGDKNRIVAMSKTIVGYPRAILGFLLGFLFVVLAIILSSGRDEIEELLFEAVPT